MEQGRNNASNQRGYQQQNGYNQQQRPNMQGNNYYQQNGYDRQINPYQPNNMNVNVNADVQTNFISKVALVLSILSFVCCCINWLFSIPAVICAVIALIKNRKDATAWGALAVSCISFIIYIILALSGAMEDVSQSMQSSSSSSSIVKESTEKTDEKQKHEVSINDNNGKTSSVNGVYEVDEIVTYRNVEYSITDIQYDDGYDEGYTMITVVFDIKNGSSDDISLGGADCIADGYTAKDVYVTSSDLADGLESIAMLSVPAGRSAKGYRSWQIPDGTSEVEICLEGRLWDDDSSMTFKFDK